MPKIIANEEIFQAVLQVVSECGYARATTKQMAEAANVSEVTLFRKFDSKRQLIKQAVTSIITQTDFDTATQYSGDVSVDLLRVVQAYQDSAVKHGQFIFIMLSELPRYPELRDLLSSPFNIFASISKLIVRYQSEGVIRPEHPMHAIAALLGPLIYVSMTQKALAETSIPPLDLENHVANFLEGRRV